MADDIKLVVGVDYSELTGLIKTGEQSKRVLSTVAKEFARTGNQKQYMHSINKIAMAQKQLDVSARMSRGELMRLGAEMQREQKFTDSLTASTNRLGGAMGASKNRMNGNNMAIQQLGYQFGDFAVQVQGGTSAFVAFSQQGAQLAGILPMVAGPLGLSMGAAVGLSAALGILIPIGSAVGRMFFEMKDSAEEANGSFDNVKETLQSLSDIDLAMGIGGGMLANATMAETKYSSILRIMKEAESIRLREQLQEPLDALKDVYAGYLSSVQYAAQLGDDAPDFDLLGMKDESRFIQAFQMLSKIQGDTREELQESVVQQSLFLQGSGLLNAEVSKILIQYADVVGVVEAAKKEQEEFTEETKKTSKSADKFLGFLNKTLDKLDETNAAQKLSNDALMSKTALMRVEQEYGAESLKYKKLAAAQEDVALIAKLKLKGVDEDLINFAVYQLQTQREITREIERQSKVKFNMMEGSAAAQAMRKYAGRSTTSDKDPQTGDGTSIYKDPPKAKRDPVADFETKLKLERELLNATEARQKVLQALGSDFVKDNPKRAAAMEVTITETNRLIAVEEKRQGLIDSITGSIENGMMAMIDGTLSVKDAFKSMASEIIKELYRVLVVQQMVNAAKLAFGGGLFGGASWSADGDVVGSSGIQAYANGGVVDSPTMFQHGGGLGVMGEAGPEAIMPLKRGSNGKLGVQMEGGSQGNVVINQSFNFQANGDDSVKKLIAQAAPKIADMAKASVIDSRRRGGSTKAAFG